MNIEQMIERAAAAAAERAAKKTVAELRRQGMLKEQGFTRYRNAEDLLRKYGLPAAESGLDAEQVIRIEQALAAINDVPYAQAVPLYYFAGKTNAEIAEILHASERTVQRARQKLVQRLSAKIT